VASEIACPWQSSGRNSGFGIAKDTDDLLLGKKLLHGDALTWQMKTLLTSRCVNQRGESQWRGFFNGGMDYQISNINQAVIRTDKKEAVSVLWIATSLIVACINL